MDSKLVEEGKESLGEAGKEGAAKKEEETELTAAEIEKQRVERKRNREKQRRSDVTKGLEALLDLIFRIDPKLKLDAEERAANTAGGRITSDSSLLSRVELINIAVLTLERIHQENEERKMVITHLTRGLLAGKAAANHPEGAGPLPPSAGADLQQKLALEALLSTSAGAQPPLRGSLLGEAGGLGLPGGSPSLRRGGLVRPPASSLLPPGLAAGLAAGGPSPALYREIMNRRIQDEETAALAAAGLGPIGSNRTDLLGRAPSDAGRSVLAQATEKLAASGDSTRKATEREQTIAQAAAANSSGTSEDGPALKRFKGRMA